MTVEDVFKLTGRWNGWQVMVGGGDMEPNLHTKIKVCKLSTPDSGYIPIYRINNYVIPEK
jgi:hypothetical protein